MFYHVFYPLQIYFSSLRIFEYITFRSIFATLTSLILCFLFGQKIISYLKKRQILQSIRPDGPPTHQAKYGTPTMGGLIILLSLVVSTLLWARLDNRFILLTLISVFWLGMLGFLDDYLKVIKKNPQGLSKTTKFAGQMVLAFIISCYLFFYPPNIHYATFVDVPYLKNAYLNLGIFYIVFSMFVIIGSSNAVNLTDGLDGLAIGSIAISAFTYAIFAYLAGNAKIAQYLKIIPVAGAGELTVFLSALVGAALGFLWFNGYPAEIFMGDTGSLFLGATIGLVAVFIKQELVLVIVGGVFVMEVISVVLQVFSYKRYKKRILRMAPLHHHFELGGLSESKVTVRFWIVGIILALIAFSSLKIR